MDVLKNCRSALKRIPFTALFLAQAAYCAIPGQAWISTTPQKLSIDDSIEISRLADPDYFLGNLKKDQVAHFSPNGKHFFVVLRKADLARNSNVYSIILFKTSTCLTRSSPRTLLQLSSTTNYPAISAARWLSDDDTITFLGAINQREPQLYSVGVSNGRLRQLTHQRGPIFDYRTTQNCRLLVYLMSLPGYPIARSDGRREQTIAVTDQTLSNIMLGDVRRDIDGYELFAQSEGHRARRLVRASVFDNPTLDLSPDGRFVTVVHSLKGKELDPAWKDYPYPKDGNPRQSFDEANRYSTTPFTQILVVDTSGGAAKVLWNRPTWRPIVSAWAPNGRSVFLKGVPFASQSIRSQASEGASSPSIDIEVNIATLQWKPISATEWPATRNPKAPWTVSLEEDVNHPPKLWAEDPASRRRAMILNLNPQLDPRALRPVETLKWRVHGVDVIGGLYLPVADHPSSRLPLVIQTHGFDPDRWSTDGRNEWSSGFAARALANGNIAVLQTYQFVSRADHDRIAEDRTLGATAEESFRTFAKLVYEGAVEELDERGIIDPTRVGISGFSRTVWFVGYTLTHSERRFAAAILTDGIDAGYFSYLAFGEREYEVDNGNWQPFGPAGLAQWAKESPTFNLDEVHTPIRLVSLNTTDSVLLSWEWYEGLRLQGRPVDFTIIPAGAHLLERPRDRKTAIEGTVDWFRFWLQGIEDKSPEKVDEYARWRHLREIEAHSGN